MSFVFSPMPVVSVPVLGQPERFPVHRIYCVGRNYEEHAVPEAEQLITYTMNHALGQNAYVKYKLMLPRSPSPPSHTHTL
jgi:hypothetical protein